MPNRIAATLDLDDARAVARRKRVLRALTFQYDGCRLPYHVDGGNKPFDNERAVEVAVAQHVLTAHEDPTRVIEIGNVLAHYAPIEHAVLDNFAEHAAVTWKQDLFTFGPPFRPELIISLSLLQQIRHVERPSDFARLSRAVAKLLAWLAPSGELVITLPLGYNPYVLTLLDDPASPFDHIVIMKRVSTENEWAQVPMDEVRATEYDRPFPCANAIVITRAHKCASAAAVTGLPADRHDEATPSSGGSTTSEDLKDFYDHQYYRRMAGGQIHQRRGHLRELTNIWRAASLILTPRVRHATDVGAGRGELARHLIESGTRVTVLDYAAPAIEIARGYVGESNLASFVVGDAKRLTDYVAPASQDAVFMTDVVEHISTPELRVIFAEVRKILAPGGTFVVHTPEKYSGSVTSTSAVHGLHINLFDIDTLRDLLAQSFAYADAFTWNGVERFASRGKSIELFGIGRHEPYITDSYPDDEGHMTSEVRLVTPQAAGWSRQTLVERPALPPRFILRFDLEILHADGDAQFQVLLCNSGGQTIAWTGLVLSRFQESPADLFLTSETFNRVIPGDRWRDVAHVVARATYIKGAPVDLRVTDIRVLHAAGRSAF